MDNLVQLKDFASSAAVESWLFYALATLAIALSVGVISDSKVIRSGFILIGVFGAISGLFLLLKAQFLALAQVMIYAVGITLVVVIALMLTNPRLEKEEAIEELIIDQEPPMRRFVDRVKAWTPGIVGFFSFITIYIAVRSENWSINTEAMDPNNVHVLGTALTTVYSLPFEFASVLLLAALIGAIMLAKSEPKGTEEAVVER
jgi:NADH:ubiquinone oxidoreductase subunit 6 (subunit J)